MKTNLLTHLKTSAEETEQFLSAYLTRDDKDIARIWEAMRYSVLAGGKRIRPFITKEVGKMVGANPEVALYFGAALELIHSYSLVHDDLPCMDNDDFRRGRPTCHKRFDEATAVLAGDALLTHAFDLVLKSPAGDMQKLKAIEALTEAAGCDGMIGGQVMDLHAEKVKISEETLIKLQDLKTGALLVCAAKLGCIAGECYGGETFDALVGYAKDIGLVFQIVDDILDSYGTVAIGKPMHSDEENGKTTFLTLFGLEGAREYAEKTTIHALSLLESIDNHQVLAELAEFLLTREK